MATAASDVVEVMQRSLTVNNDSSAHYITLYAIALSIRAKRILELGVRGGETSFPLIAAARITGGHVYSVDINRTEFMPEPGSPWTFYLMDAISFLEGKAHAKEQYDLVFVDDWHSYPHVRRELELIAQLVTPTSVVLLHDLMAFNREPFYFNSVDEPAQNEFGLGGPFRAVSELDRTTWEWATIPVSNGLTLLRKIR